MVRTTLFIIMLIGLSACSDSVRLSGAKTQGENPLNFNGSLGVKNFRQITASFFAATGVDNAATQAALTNNQQFLAQNGTVEQLSFAVLSALARLGATYCTELGTTGRQTVYAGVNFAQGPAGLTPAISEQVIRNLAVRFWGRGPTPAEISALQALMNEGGAAGAAAETLNRLLMVCTAISISTASIAL